MKTILLVTELNTSDVKNISYGGVEHYRMMKPHSVLNRLFPDDYEFMSCKKNEFDLDNKEINLIVDRHKRIELLTELLNKVDFVIFNREMFPPAIELLQSLNKPYALDLDDYWVVPGYHELSQYYKDHNVKELTENGIRHAKFVMCTTPILAEKIKPFNENVYVVENGIDVRDEIWQPRKVVSPRIRFGFTQGSTHFEDLKTLSSSVKRAMGEDWFIRYCQINLCGWSNPKEEDKHYNWKYQNQWQFIELAYTDGHRLVGSIEYALELRKYQPYNDINMPYKRTLALPVVDFGGVYNSIDVSVVPLKDNTFNSCKSELKMIEAGFMDCGVFVSFVKPYTLLANDKNSFDLNKKTFREWAKFITFNPNALNDSKAQLREDVERYNLNDLSLKRNEIYKKYL